MDYRNQVVVITGGAHGIGKALVEAYCQRQANVIFLDKDHVKGSELEFRLRVEKHKCTFVHVDLQNLVKAQEAIALIYKMFHHINILLNNVGVSSFSNLYETTPAQFMEVIQTNLGSTFACSQIFAKLRKSNHHEHLLGRIINLSSTRAYMSQPHTEAYGASKGGIAALTHTLAMSLSELNVQVNAIAPGWIHTDVNQELTEGDHSQHPSNRVGRTEDVVRTCLYLSEEGNDFINGQTIVIDGGMSKKMMYVD